MTQRKNVFENAMKFCYDMEVCHAFQWCTNNYFGLHDVLHLHSVVNGCGVMNYLM